MLKDDSNLILEKTRDFWKDLQGERIFVTGGTGFFGKWLLDTVISANHQLNADLEVHVLTRDPVDFQSRNPGLAGQDCVVLHSGDVRDFKGPEGRFAAVIHAATPAVAKTPDEIEPKRLYETIVRGTENTLEFALRSKARRFLNCSSGAVYGRQPLDVDYVDEEYLNRVPHPPGRTPYGDGKAQSELLCEQAWHRDGLETVSARCFAFVGPHLALDAHFAIGNFIRDGLVKRVIQVQGDGTPYRSYLYAADLMIWLWTLLMRGTPGQSYNVGSGERLKIADLAQRVAEFFGTKVQISQKPIPGHPGERYVPSVQRVASELGLQASIGIKESIHRTARFYCKDA